MLCVFWARLQRSSIRTTPLFWDTLVFCVLGVEYWQTGVLACWSMPGMLTSAREPHIMATSMMMMLVCGLFPGISFCQGRAAGFTIRALRCCTFPIALSFWFALKLLGF